MEMERVQVFNPNAYLKSRIRSSAAASLFINPIQLNFHYIFPVSLSHWLNEQNTISSTKLPNHRLPPILSVSLLHFLFLFCFQFIDKDMAQQSYTETHENK